MRLRLGSAARLCGRACIEMTSAHVIYVSQKKRDHVFVTSQDLNLDQLVMDVNHTHAHLNFVSVLDRCSGRLDDAVDKERHAI